MRLLALSIVALLSAGAAGPMPRVVTLAAMKMTTAGEATAPLTSVSSSTAPCFGTCPVYSVTALRYGYGGWECQKFVAAMGGRAFTVTPAQFAAFAAALAPHHRNGGHRLVTLADCGSFITDSAGVGVVWTDDTGLRDVLSADFGCGPDANRTLFAGLKDAIRTLPVAALIGRAGS